MENNNMKYMGSKARISKYILPIILKDRSHDQWYVEPFVGGANSISEVDGLRIGGELNIYISAMWTALEIGWVPPIITKDQYHHIKNNKHEYSDYLVGWVGICCSYSGKWFGGYAGKVETKGGPRDYQAEALSNVNKQLPKIKGIKFIQSDYHDLDIPFNSIIYCDPPYASTTGYDGKFNHEVFWQWCRDKAKQGHKVFISEYQAPKDFICIWHHEVKSSLSANGNGGGNKKSIEKLFVHNSQYYRDSIMSDNLVVVYNGTNIWKNGDSGKFYHAKNMVDKFDTFKETKVDIDERVSIDGFLRQPARGID